ncbi:hypothetical protein DFJ74DRAFT_688318 [Hyaloraphidium curvatum]|nr:hypothetical protein DFJ74DRAFT_688318 [Hyaloraphidium curvatum]
MVQHRTSTAMVLTATALLVALLASPAEAAPAAPHVVFARSCSECAGTSFCEFSYPGAPQDRVACVAAPAGDPHELYRRYANSGQFTNCGSHFCCSYEGQQDPGITDRDECQASCEARPGCTHFEFAYVGGPSLFQCKTFTGCTAFGDNPSSVVFAQAPATCPTATC